ncbi:MAG: helix-turn-helix transcriptional regulator [Treponema sp.]|nr:helix-turn-helix transcriptional regulator [Treponema sp.]
MNFWERVNDLLEKNDINKKTLATDAGFDASNITKGIKNNNIPSAETAVKIAARLGVSVEYLVTGKDSFRNNADIGKGVYLYQKYHTVIDSLEGLSNTKQKSVMRIVEECVKLGR